MPIPFRKGKIEINNTYNAKIRTHILSAVKKAKLFLHIGHGKTGTSAVQSSLAIASERLLKKGINYPIHPSLRDRSSQLEITSGNWAPNPEVNLTHDLLRIAENNHDSRSTILSSESLFWEIPELIKNKQEWQNYIDLHIILAVREVEEMLSSEYQQRIKRHGDSMPLEQFIRARKFISSHHEKAAEIIDLMAQSGTANTIINYSKHKRDISQMIFKLIGAEEAYPAERMDEVIINRSLSRKELEIMITINKLYYNKIPTISTKISDVLIKNQPKTEAKMCKIIPQQLEKVYATNFSFIETINLHLNQSEQLSTSPQESTPQSSTEREQKIREEEALSIHLIAETLKEVLINESKQKLSNETIDAIIKFSQSRTVTKTTEVELLEVAKENRPQGQALARLLERAKKELAKE